MYQTPTIWGRGFLAAAVFAAMATVAGSSLAAEPFPHQARPDAWPQPDYFTEALKLTPYRPAERFSALKLARGIEPDLLVLPVQQQVFGWTPAFNSLVAARLDRELAERGAKANRQTDLFDVDGPFVRRFDDAQVAKFASGHPKADVLALYLGHDGAGKALVTMVLHRKGRVTTSHRVAADGEDPAVVVAAVGNALPSMLTELGIGKAGARPMPAPAPCREGDWDLPDLKLNDPPSVRACHAMIMGILAPEFHDRAIRYARARTPAKLAWLAQAYALADALPPQTANAVRVVVWSQLDLTNSFASPAEVIQVSDPVVLQLTRLIWAPDRTKQMPIVATRETADAYAEEAAQSLPPFAKAVFMERARYSREFRHVDLCSMEWQLPSMLRPKACLLVQAIGPRPRSLASDSQWALLEEWRLATAVKDIMIQGEQRGDPQARQEVLDELTPRLAAHPFVRRAAFVTAEFDKASGDYDKLAAGARVATADFVQATADIQQLDRLLGGYAVHYRQWTRNEALAADAAIANAADDEKRMFAALAFDGFAMRPWPADINPNAPRGMVERMMTAGSSKFLRPGHQWSQSDPAPQSTAQYVVQQPSPRQMLLNIFARPTFSGNAVQPPPVLENWMRTEPSDMMPRVLLTMARMKEGGTLAQSRQSIDTRPKQGPGRAIAESHAWAVPAHAMFFAAELDAAREFYEKVADIGTGSDSDMLAQVRLRLLEGDITAASRATQRRLERYEADFPRRDLAGFEFMQERHARAWALLAPRLSVSSEVELWTSVDVGRRIEHKSVKEILDLAARSGWGHAREAEVDILDSYLGRFIAEDRIPSDEELALLAQARKRSVPRGIAVLEARAKLQQMAFAPRLDEAKLQSVESLIVEGFGTNEVSMVRPLYAWIAWNKSGGKDDALQRMRSANFHSDFDSILAKGVILALDGNRAEALQYLRAARIEMGGLGVARMDGRYRSAPYAHALASYLLFNKTRDEAYREEALRLARAYQRIFPFLAWPYALDALLSPDGPARVTAACRAQYLDRDSLFLKLSKLNPAAQGPACKQAMW